MKKIFLAFSLIISTFTIQAQTESSDGGEVFAMLTENESNSNLDGLVQSYEKFTLASKHNLFEVPSNISKNKSSIKFKIKLRTHLIVNGFSFLFDRQAHKNEPKAKRFRLNSKSVITKHSKELAILNASNCANRTAYEHLCLNIPTRSMYKTSTMQGEEMQKGTVQEESIHIGRLPQEVYLLEAWSLGE